MAQPICGHDHPPMREVVHRRRSDRRFEFQRDVRARHAGVHREPVDRQAPRISRFVIPKSITAVVPISIGERMRVGFTLEDGVQLVFDASDNPLPPRSAPTRRPRPSLESYAKVFKIATSFNLRLWRRRSAAR